MQAIPSWTDSYIHGDEKTKIENHIEAVFCNEQYIRLFNEHVAGPVIVSCSCDVLSSTVYAVASDNVGRKVATLKIDLDNKMHTTFEALV